MVGRFNGGVIEAPDACASLDPIDNTLISLAKDTAVEYEKLMEKMDLNGAIKSVWALISRANKYIDETGPWALAKDPAKKERLNTVLYNLVETLRITAVLISPFMPLTGPKIWEQLGLNAPFASTTLQDAQQWSKMPAGTVVRKPVPIFPRIEEKAEEPQTPVIPARKQPQAQASPVSSLPEVTIDEFAKMDFRVAKVLAAEKVKGADKLLTLTVDLGTEQRTIVSGIAKHYTPEELVNQTVVMIVNLKPAKIRGIESRGMVLAASGDDKLALVTAPGMLPGSKVK